MAQLNFMPLRPLRQPDVSAAAVGLGDNRIDELVTRFIRLALRVQGVTPIAICRFGIWVDRDRFCEPNSGRIKVIVAKLWISGLVSLLEFHIARIQRGLVEIWVQFQRVFVTRKRLVQFSAYKGGLAFVVWRRRDP